MPRLTVDGVRTVEVPQGKRLVLALKDEAGIDQLHSCSGNARCTTCRVEFILGEPVPLTAAEKDVLGRKGLIGTAGLRLSCQIACEQDMELRVISRLQGSGRPDAGHRPTDEIEPRPVTLVSR
jgi:ferredoxin